MLDCRSLPRPPLIELLFKLFVVRGAVRLPMVGGISAARLCGVRAMSQPLAKIGVSGRLHEVCSLRSSLGLGIDFLGKAPDTKRRLELMPGSSGGNVPGWIIPPPPAPPITPPCTDPLAELNEGLR